MDTIVRLYVDRSWHRFRSNITDWHRNTENLSYVGISDASVVIETKSGERWRITNPDFVKGLKIEKTQE